MQRLPVGKFLGFTGVSWGIILMTTPACTSFAGIAVNRFMLGLVEAAVNPGFVLVMSMWYTAKEQPLRLETYYCTNGIATMFGGLLGYAIGHISGGIAKWMYVFIIFGAMSLVAGIATLWFLPVAIERVAANRQGVKNHNFKTDQAWQTVADPKTWILFILAVSAQVPNAAITSVSKTMTP
jgi:MFS family permease